MAQSESTSSILVFETVLQGEGYPIMSTLKCKLADRGVKGGPRELQHLQLRPHLGSAAWKEAPVDAGGQVCAFFGRGEEVLRIQIVEQIPRVLLCKKRRSRARTAGQPCSGSTGSVSLPSTVLMAQTYVEQHSETF